MREQRLERRVVTALFVGIVGSTTLTQTLGPERVKRALDRAFGELAAPIAGEGGTVEKYIGDAIHALFGVPATHPDDPWRGLRAADACVRWAAHSRGSAPVPLEVRAGVETGEAIIDLAATETERQRMSIAACVNVAARLQQLAEPGQVVDGPTWREAIADAADFVSLETRRGARRPCPDARPAAGARLPWLEPAAGLPTHRPVAPDTSRSRVSPGIRQRLPDGGPGPVVTTL